MTAMLKRIRDNDNVSGYIFIAPWLIGFFAFTLLPILSSLFFSFTRYDLLSPPSWIGLQNYQDMLFNDRRFWKALYVTFGYVFLHVPIRLVFALLVALLLAGKHRFLGVYRALFYVPSIIGGSVAIAVIWRRMFGVDGVFNSLLISLGIIDRGIGWLGEPNTAIWTIILLAVWQFGSPMLIFLAGLKQIPASYYEAADMDGAGVLGKFFRITLPMLAPVMLFNLIMQTITGFRAFTESYIITEGGPFDSTLLYMLYIFQKTFKFNDMGYGCALAWVLLAIIGILTVIIFKVSSKSIYYESRGNW